MCQTTGMEEGTGVSLGSLGHFWRARKFSIPEENPEHQTRRSSWPELSKQDPPQPQGSLQPRPREPLDNSGISGRC